MSARARRGAAAGLAALLTVVLAAVAVGAYRDRPQTGLQIIRRAAVTDRSRTPVSSRNGP